MPTIRGDQVLIRYVLKSGLHLSTFSPAKFGESADLSSYDFPHEAGVGYLVLDRSRYYGPDFVWKEIARITGRPEQNLETFRCVVVDHDDLVASVEVRDPEFTPAGGHPSLAHEKLAILHLHAEIGDRHVGNGNFERKWAAVDRRLGVVKDIFWHPVSDVVPIHPDGHFCLAHKTAEIYEFVGIPLR